jgi:hypothetical protein
MFVFWLSTLFLTFIAIDKVDNQNTDTTRDTGSTEIMVDVGPYQKDTFTDDEMRLRASAGYRSQSNININSFPEKHYTIHIVSTMFRMLSAL